VRHGLGRLLTEENEGVLVHDERVRKHVAPRGGQQVNLLKAVQLVLVETGLALLNMTLNLKRRIEIWVTNCIL
jgi:hypothetical protein